MPASALPGLVVCRFQGRVPSGIQCEMTCHAVTIDDSANTLVKMVDLANALYAWWTSAGVRALHTNGSAMDQVTVQDLSPAGLTSQVVTGTVAGTRGTGSPVSSQDSLVVTKFTGLAGEAFRGRMYTWGGLATDLDAAGGLWDSAFAGAWTTQFTAMQTAMAAGAAIDYVPVLWHKDAGKSGTPTADSYTEVLYGTGRQELAVVKGRRD